MIRCQPTELVAKLEKAWPSLIMQAFGMVEEEGKSRSAKQEEDVPQLDAATSAKRDRSVARTLEAGRVLSC